MKRSITSLLSLFGIVAFSQSVAWPPLPKDGFIIGRAATKADVAAGRAVFVAAQGEVIIGKPLALAIPQYAWYKNGSKREASIIIQAEEANGKRLVGARLLSGRFVAGFISDFELLGASTPNATTP